MLSAKIYILSWKLWNKTFYCGSQTRIIADYTRNQIVFMRPLTYQNPVSKRVNSILYSLGQNWTQKKMCWYPIRQQQQQILLIESLWLLIGLRTHSSSLHPSCIKRPQWSGLFTNKSTISKREIPFAWHLEMVEQKRVTETIVRERESVSHKTGNCKLWMNNSGDRTLA